MFQEHEDNKYPVRIIKWSNTFLSRLSYSHVKLALMLVTMYTLLNNFKKFLGKNAIQIMITLLSGNFWFLEQ